MVRIVILVLSIFIHAFCFSQQQQALVSKDDFLFLKKITETVIDSSRIFPGQSIPSHGANNTGSVLIRPGGRNAYPAFWIRDYAMSLETGFITGKEQKHMLLLAASTQCDQTGSIDFFIKQNNIRSSFYIIRCHMDKKKLVAIRRRHSK